jgi:hypothetical protein
VIELPPSYASTALRVGVLQSRRQTSSRQGGSVIGDDALTLSDEQLERLAELLAIKLAAVRPAVPSMLTVEDICNAFKVSRAWVYDNAGRLGGIKLGPGQRGPLRFPANRVAEALKPPVAAATANPPAPAPMRPNRRRPKRLHPVYDG